MTFTSFRNLDENDDYVSTVTESINKITDITNSTLKPSSDIGVDAVITSLYFNGVIFVFLILGYELLRRKFPTIYQGRRHHVSADRQRNIMDLPSGCVPINWIASVYQVSWKDVRESCGLDTYMFLRYIRMCCKIVTVTGIWAIIILWPVFALGNNGAEGFYYFSLANVPLDSSTLWVPAIFMWVFSFYVYYAMDSEYQHFTKHRMEFMGKGDPDVDKQYHYSLLVEEIPDHLRSDQALQAYFEHLFPGRIHSATVAMKLSHLESLVLRRKRVVHRLEKSIASYEASGIRPQHVAGKPRINCCGVQTEPIDCFCHCCVDDRIYEGYPPPKGAHVDSIRYYANELREMNKDILELQYKQKIISKCGDEGPQGSNLLEKILERSNASSSKNAVVKNSSSDDVQYGSLGISPEMKIGLENSEDKVEPLLEQSNSSHHEEQERRNLYAKTSSDENLLPEEHQLVGQQRKIYEVRSSTAVDMDSITIENIANNLGLDFIKDRMGFVGDQIETYVDDLSSIMSSTGFVTFKDLATKTVAVSANITQDKSKLKLQFAPEPRDIIWNHVSIDKSTHDRRVSISNLYIALGAIFWSIPLSLIQLLATAETVAQIPGMDWIITFEGGALKTLINGYLPVAALLGLILLLPIIFEQVAFRYERCKTFSGVQNSILNRYFYYQLANVYITVTAASIWNSLAGVIDHPTYVLEIFSSVLPTVVGYFVSLLLTKLFAGLPMVLLRVGALSRMLFLRSIFSEKYLSQKELDEVYRPQMLLFGWEYPTQLLVSRFLS